MVTSFNSKDLKRLGEYVLSKKRTDRIKSLYVDAPEILEERLSCVDSDDIEHALGYKYNPKRASIRGVNISYGDIVFVNTRSTKIGLWQRIRILFGAPICTSSEVYVEDEARVITSESKLMDARPLFKPKTVDYISPV